MRHTKELFLAAPVAALVATAGCAAGPDPSAIVVARLEGDGGAAFARLRRSFAARNAGYDVTWLEQVTVAFGAPAAGAERTAVLFVQAGEGQGSVGAARSELRVGDIVVLRSGETLAASGSFSALRFDVPGAPAAAVPPFIRPDFDPRITDTPGGCADEASAYRRILLTWLGRNGPYLFHGLNAHRVRITDSFSHYHPVTGGFDELYLVQMAAPEARLLVSEQVDLIEAPERVTARQARGLLREIPLRAGDLVLLPRGTVHRGLGNVLAQVITAPGFVPGAEIGVDHHLKRINERLGLAGDRALPLNEKASAAALVK